MKSKATHSLFVEWHCIHFRLNHRMQHDVILFWKFECAEGLNCGAVLFSTPQDNVCTGNETARHSQSMTKGYEAT